MPFIVGRHRLATLPSRPSAVFPTTMEHSIVVLNDVERRVANMLMRDAPELWP